MSQSLLLNEVCVIVNTALDNVAISKVDLNAGISIYLSNGNTIVVKDSIVKGQRFAVRDITEGQSVVQYGCPFGVSTGIGKGELVHGGNILEIETNLEADFQPNPPETVYREEFVSKTFDGYRRLDGTVGTRNYYLVVPTSLCASQVAVQIANEALKKCQLVLNFPNIDGIVPIPNTEGCGCASNVQIDRFLRVLQNFITHTNVGGVLIVDLGCEQTNYAVLYSYLKNNSAFPTVPTDWLTIQKEGGTRKSVEKGLGIIEKRLAVINRVSRSKCAIEHLVVGTECGASDAFSGITANPLIGNVVDKVITGSGGAILSEVTEMVGVEQILMCRMRSREIATKFMAIMNWYLDLAKTLGVNISDNLVPENRAGGLINPCIKSLGAIAKGGTTAIEDVLDYGERLSKRGLHIMQGPGNDIESVTGMVASGVNIVCFSTGKGTVTGSAIVPVIKVSSTTELFRKMPDDIDFDSGLFLEPHNMHSLDDLGDELLKVVLAVASGKKTLSEQNDQRQFQVWTAGKLSL